MLGSNQGPNARQPKTKPSNRKPPFLESQGRNEPSHPLSLQKGQKTFKRSLQNDIPSPFQQQEISTSDSWPDSSTSGNEYKTLRRKYLMLEEDSITLGRELGENEDEVKTLEDEKLALLDQLVVLEGLIDPSEFDFKRLNSLDNRNVQSNIAQEILQSEFINGSEKRCEEGLSSSIEQADVEAEVLLHLLVLMKEKKEKLALKLMEDSRYLEVDIKEIEKKRSSISSLNPTHFLNDGPFDAGENNILNKVPFCSEISLPSSSSSNDSRLIKNMDHLESAYFSLRSSIQLPETDANTRPDNDLLKIWETLCIAKNNKGKQKSSDRLGAFFDGLCKYARYSKFEVRGVLRNDESMNAANVISSLSFDRDEEYFATARVSKKIKIFEFQSLFNDSVDIHYPVIEMPNKSKLSCVC